MKLSYEGELIEANANNSFFLNYPNDMMSGLYVDVDAENYLFIHADSERFDEVAIPGINEGIRQITMPENVNLSDVPHCYVMQSLARFTVQTAEVICQEAAGE